MKYPNKIKKIPAFVRVVKPCAARNIIIIFRRRGTKTRRDETIFVNGHVYRRVFLLTTRSESEWTKKNIVGYALSLASTWRVLVFDRNLYVSVFENPKFISDHFCHPVSLPLLDYKNKRVVYGERVLLPRIRALSNVYNSVEYNGYAIMETLNDFRSFYFGIFIKNKQNGNNTSRRFVLLVDL